MDGGQEVGADGGPKLDGFFEATVRLCKVSVNESFDGFGPCIQGRELDRPCTFVRIASLEPIGEIEGPLVFVSHPVSPSECHGVGNEVGPGQLLLWFKRQRSKRGFGENVGEGDVDDVVLEAARLGREPARFAREGLSPADGAFAPVRFEQGFQGGHPGDELVFTLFEMRCVVHGVRGHRL